MTADASRRRCLRVRLAASPGRTLTIGGICLMPGNSNSTGVAIGGPCYACTFPEPEAGHEPPAQAKGVVGALPGVRKLQSHVILARIKDVKGLRL